MCIIIQSKTGDIPDKERLALAYDNNPHGFGLMWSEGKKVNVITGILDFDQIWQTLQYVDGHPFALHFRWVTRGTLHQDQCHPFQITSRRSHGKDMWMMHNGTFFFLNEEVKGYEGRKSDSQVFAEHLGTILRSKSSPDVLFSEKVQSRMRSKIGSHNKMVFLNDDGRMEIFNENAGRHDDNFWYSNVYSFIPGYRKEFTPAKKSKKKLKKKSKRSKFADKEAVGDAFNRALERSKRAEEQGRVKRRKAYLEKSA